MTVAEQNTALRPAILRIEVLNPTTTLFADRTITVKFIFNIRGSDIRGFGPEDLDLSQANCKLVPGSLRLDPADGITWIAQLKPNEDAHSFRSSVIRVKQDGIQDAQNIPGVGMSLPSLAYSVDARRPKLIAGEDAITVDGNKVVLRFDHNLDAVNPPSKGRFVVRSEHDPYDVIDVLVTGGDVTLTLATPVIGGQSISVSYRVPTVGVNADIHVIQNSVGNDALSVSQIARNITPSDTTPPALDSATVNGRELVLHYTDANSLSATRPERSAFTVHTTDGTVIDVAGVAVNAAAKTVTLTLATPVTRGQAVYLNYHDLTPGNDARAIQDAAGNDAASIQRMLVTSPPAGTPDAPDTTPPEINRATINGTQLVLSYTEAGHLYAEGELNRQSFTVMINGVRSQVVNAAVNATANTITLTLAKAAAPGDDVLMSYSAPADQYVRDTSNNHAGPIDDMTVDNIMPLPQADTAAPVLITEGPRAPRAEGTRLVLHYTDASNLSAIGPDPSAFRVGVDPIDVTKVDVDTAAKTVTLTLAIAVVNAHHVWFGYTDPAGNNINAIQDAFGNDAASITFRPIPNGIHEVTPPVLVLQGADAPRVNGDRLVLHYTDANDLASGDAAPPTSAFTVSVDKVAVAVTAVKVVGKTVELTLDIPVLHGQKVAFSYTDPSTRDDVKAIQDEAGNDAASSITYGPYSYATINQPVTNDTPAPVTPVPPGQDRAPPELARITIDTSHGGHDQPLGHDNRVVLSYTDENRLDASHKPANEAFTMLRGDGTTNAVTDVVIDADAKTVTLTLADSVRQGEVLRLSYDNSSGLMNSQLIRDEAGNRAENIQSELVTNLADNTPPVPVTEGPNAPRIDGDRLVLHCTDASPLSFYTPLNSDFTVRVGSPGNETVNAVYRVLPDPVAKTVTLWMTNAVEHGQRVTLAYENYAGDVNTNNELQDASGNDALSFGPVPVNNLTPERAPPELVTTGTDVPTVNGQQLVLHYTDANLLSATGPGKAAFTVRVNGAINTVTDAVVNVAAKTVTLALTTAVTPGQAVTVSYTDPSNRNDFDAIQDAAGNDAASFPSRQVTNITGDTTPPVLAIATLDGRELVLRFTDNANLGATGPGKAAFTVRAGDAVIAISGEPVVNAAAKTVTLTLATAVAYGQTVTVSYTDPGTGNDVNAIQDAAGNDADSFTNQPVNNNTPDTTPPLLVPTGADAPRVSGQQVVLHFSDANDLHATGPLANAFAVRVDGAEVAVTGVVVNAAAKSVTLTLATAPTPGQTVAVGYTDPSAGDDPNAIQDAAGNDVGNFSTTIAVPSAADTTPPVLVTSGTDAPRVSGREVVLHFSDASHLHTIGPGAEAFAVRVGGAVVAVTGVVVDPVAKSVTLTLATAATPGQAVAVSYTDPSARNDPKAIQDAAGNDVGNFNITITLPSAVDTTPPVLVAAGADAPRVSGQEVLLHFTDANHLHTIGPLAKAFTVLVGGTVVAVTGVVVNAAAQSVTLTLATAATPDQTVIVNYTDPSAGDDPKAIQDAAGNDALSFSTTITPPPAADTTPPVLVPTGANAPRVSGREVVLHFSDANDLHATGPLADAFTVRVAGAVVAVTDVVVDAADKSVTLTLGAAATPGQTVTVNYTDPSAGNDPKAIQDAAGNDVGDFSTTITLPSAVDTTPPVLVTTGADAPRVSGQEVVLHFSDANHLGTIGPGAEAFAVRVGDTVVAVTRVVVNAAAQSVTLTLATAPTPDQKVTVSYTDPSAGNDPKAIQDAAGNDMGNFNITITPPPAADTTPPMLVTTGADAPRVSGKEVVLHFSDANDLDTTGPGAEAFAVRVGDTVVAVTGVVVNAAAQSVTLTLATAPTPGQKVIVSYTDPSAGNDPKAIQDAAGNDASSFSTPIVLQRPTEPDPVTPDTPPTTPMGPPSNPRILPPDDNDGVPGIEEDKIPGITGPGGAAPLAGDGNGDGIKDSQQSAVASMNGMTLVAGSHDGKPQAGSNVRIAAMEQQAAPANLPKGLEMPMGLLRFEATLAAGSFESFSLYVDPAQGVNGYWVRDDTGVWVNLASEPHGGKMVTEGGRLRLDFKITDGGPFDADGKADGLITALGAAGHAQLSIVGQTHDQEHLGFWF